MWSPLMDPRAVRGARFPGGRILPAALAGEFGESLEFSGLNIFHYLPRIRLAQGGVVRAVLDMCTIMQHHGHEVTLATYDDTDRPDSWSGDAGVNVAVVQPPDRPLGRFSRARLEAFRPHIEACDVAHLHTPWDPVNDQLGRMIRAAGRQYCLSIHGMLDDWSIQQKHLKKLIGLKLFAGGLMARAARIHCTAEFELTQSRKWFPRTEGFVAPLVFDLEEFRDLPGPGPAREAFAVLREAAGAGGGGGGGSAGTLLFLSRIHYKKGLDVLLRAAGELHRQGRKVHVLIAGTAEDAAYDKQMRDLASELGLRDHAHFLGLVTGRVKASLFESADLFVLPTSQENFGFVFPEALACRTPVLTTRGVDIWPELERSGGAVIVTRDPAEIAARCAELLDDPGRREAMGEAGRAWVFDYLDPDEIVKRYEELYRATAR